MKCEFTEKLSLHQTTAAQYCPATWSWQVSLDSQLGLKVAQSVALDVHGRRCRGWKKYASKGWEAYPLPFAFCRNLEFSGTQQTSFRTQNPDRWLLLLKVVKTKKHDDASEQFKKVTKKSLGNPKGREFNSLFTWKSGEYQWIPAPDSHRISPQGSDQGT